MPHPCPLGPLWKSSGWFPYLQIFPASLLLRILAGGRGRGQTNGAWEVNIPGLFLNKERWVLLENTSFFTLQRKNLEICFICLVQSPQRDGALIPWTSNPSMNAYFIGFPPFLDQLSILLH